MAQVLRDLPRPLDPNLLVATDTCDDAGVYRLRADLALVQTVDFFPPLVDDPYTFGQIAAANALSDVYAMNGRPLLALNIVGFPDDELPLGILGDILHGAAERVTAAGALTVGGHTVRDREIKFGLAVTGTVHPDELLTNAGAKPGDLLVLTKPLGTGFVTTAAKREECPPAVLERAIASMTQLNEIGRDALREAGGVHALTDVTGFGLAGHAAEIANASATTLQLRVESLPVIHGASALAIPKYFTRASKSNREHLENHYTVGPHVDLARLEFAFDAQTSGGLLIVIDPNRADALLAALRARHAAAAEVIGGVTPRVGESLLEFV